MRSFLVQSYCNGCVSGEVNLPTVSLLSRACLFKILYLSTKRNFTCFIFLRRSFPFNDVHHSKKNNNNKVKWVFFMFIILRKTDTINPALKLYSFLK